MSSHVATVLLREGIVEPTDLRGGLEGDGGLLVLYGTGDMREVQSRTDPAATLALGVYLHRLVGAIRSMIAALDTFDALVFTGGVGEHSPIVRQRFCNALRHLGVDIGEDGGDSGTSDREIGRQRLSTRLGVGRARRSARNGSGSEDVR